MKKLKAATNEFQKELIVSVINQAGGNMASAAAALGISRASLYRKISELGIEIERNSKAK